MTPVTRNELDNIHFLIHKQFTGVPPRLCDHKVVLILATPPEIKTRDDVYARFLPCIVDYTYDHWLGKQGGNRHHRLMRKVARQLTQDFFTLPDSVRNDISEPAQ